MKRIFGLLAVNAVLIIFLSFKSQYFLTSENWIVLLNNMALEVIVLSGYTLLLIGGYFDLSVDGIVAITGVTAAIMMVAGVPWYLAVVVSMILATLIGLVNGLIVVKLGVNGLIATLCSWWICVGAALGLTRAISPYGFPPSFQWFGQMTFLGGVRLAVPLAVFSVAFLSVILHYHVIGSHIYISGDNKEASRMMGINVTRIGIGLYVLVGFLSGFVGLMIASRLNAGSPQAVDGMALRVIAAIVIGGGNLNGGEGSIITGVLGLFIMSILSNAIVLLGISPYWQKALIGGVLLTAILTQKQNILFRRV